MVQLEYTLSDDAGMLIHSNKGQPPLTYTQGDHQLMVALENQLVGLRAGQEKKVVLKPDEAFGPIDPSARTEVPKEVLPPESLVVGAQLMAALETQLVGLRAGQEKKVVLKPDEAFGPIDPSAQTEVPKEVLPPESLVVGAHLMARTATGEERPVVVKEVKDKTVVVDLNHPLAGKTLVFEIKVLGIEPPSKGGDSKATESRGPEPKAPEPKAAEPKAGDQKPTN
jgi:FKBP-type peptidyl-prolyl cis-trans isomerase SlyD